jgi:citrate lyase beta subunit
VVTLPKVTRAQHCEVFAQTLAAMERALALPIRRLKFEVMMETPQAIAAAREFYDASDGRCIAAHFGAYDFLSRMNVAADEQRLDHPFCDSARYAMKLAFADTPVALADGVTALVPNTREGDGAQVTAAWARHQADIRRSLSQGFYQSWDIHPAQLVSRYRAVQGWFRERAVEAMERWRRFTEAGERAMQSGGVFDDAATVEGLRVFFRQGQACGALTEAEVPSAGL